MLQESEHLTVVRITIRKFKQGDGSFRFSEEYATESQDVGGADQVPLEELEMRVRRTVAFDWAAIGEHLRSHDSWTGNVAVHKETVASLFVG